MSGINLYYQQYILVFLLCFARNLAFVYFFFVTSNLAMGFKMTLALVLSGITFYFCPLFLATFTQGLMLIMGNVLYGYMVALVLSLPFYLIQMNGSIVDNFRGETVAAQLSSSFIASKSSMYNLINISFLTYFICCNGLLLFLKVVFLSYQVMPINHFIDNNLVLHVSAILEHIMLWFAIISFPALIMSLLIDTIFAFSAVVVPNLNTFFLGFPLKSLGIILVYFFFVPTLFFYMMKYFRILVMHIGF